MMILIKSMINALLLSLGLLLIASTLLVSADYNYQFGPLRVRQSSRTPAHRTQATSSSSSYSAYNYAGPVHQPMMPLLTSLLLPPPQSFQPYYSRHGSFMSFGSGSNRRYFQPAPLVGPFLDYQPNFVAQPSASSPSSSLSSSSSSSSSLNLSPSSSSSSSLSSGEPVEISFSESPSAPNSSNRPSSSRPASTTGTRTVFRRPVSVRPPTPAPRPVRLPVTVSSPLNPTPTPSGAVGPAVVNDADIGFDIPDASNSDSSSLAGPVVSPSVSASPMNNVLPTGRLERNPPSSDGFAAAA